MITVYMYLLYILITVLVAIKVGLVIRKNGFTLLADVYKGKEKLAESINHLLVVGFYLIAIGFVSLALPFGGEPNTAAEVVEILSMKIGIVLFVIAGMLFYNSNVITKIRRRATLSNKANVPTEPEEAITG